MPGVRTLLWSAMPILAVALVTYTVPAPAPVPVARQADPSRFNIEKLKAADDNAHAAGLRPHHNTGGVQGDPLLFRHRYQHHDDRADQLTYYEYEARRHAHVVMVNDLDMSSCLADEDEEGQLLIKLTLPVDKLRTSNVTRGSIIVGDNLECKESMGGSKWRSILRERVVAEPIVRHTRSTAQTTIELETAPAAMHECFEHAQVEFFHGRPHNLAVAREKRMQSFAANSKIAPNDGFASTSTIMADAAQMAANRTLAARTAGNKSSTRRELYHTYCPYGPADDLHPSLSGDDCGGRTIPGSAMENSNCMWGSPDGLQGYLAGNEYTVTWTHPGYTGNVVKIQI